MNEPTGDTLRKAILYSIQDEIVRIVDEEAKNAASRVEERVRESAGMVATRVSSMVDYERMGNRMVITVNIPDSNKS